MPKLLPGDWVYQDAFQCLNAARTYNMGGPNPLAVSEILAFLDGLTLIDGLDARRAFVRTMQRLDDVVLRHTAEKQKAERKHKAPPKPSR